MHWRVAPFGLVLLAACKFTPVTDGGGGSGGAGEGGVGGEGASEAVCAPAPDCGACRECAADGPCKSYFDACFNNGACVTIDQCLTGCGSSPAECRELCAAQYPAGIDDYDAARTCMDCDQCQDICVSDFACSG